MQITRTSPFTGARHTQKIPVTAEQIATWQAGELIQNAMPNLTPDQREFLLTGITADEWNRTFGKGTVVEERSEQP